MAERIPSWDETEEIPSWDQTTEIAPEEGAAPSWESTSENLPARTGREAEGAYGEGPDLEGSELFPRASQMLGEGVLGKAAQIGTGALDLFGYPQRKPAELRGMDASDPEAHFLKPETDAAVAKAKADLEAHPELKNQPAPFGSFGGPMGVPMMPASAEMVPGLVEQGGRSMDDPWNYMGPLVQALKASPKLFDILSQAVGYGRKGAGYTAGVATGAGKEALEYAGSPYGAARMAREHGREAEIGADVLERLDKAGKAIPEAAQKDEILGKLPEMLVSPSIKKGEDVIAGLAEGTAGRGLAPSEVAGASQGQGWINWLRGGEAPPDLIELAGEAGAAAKGAKGEAAAVGSQAAQEGKAAAQAARAQAAAQAGAGKAAAGVGKAKREAGEAFYSWDKKAAEQAIPGAVDGARKAAAKAKEAAVNARAQAAVGDLSEADAAAAEAVSALAERSAHVSQAAARIQKGGAENSMRKIADDLSAQGLAKDEIAKILRSGRDRVEAIKALPPDKISARELDKLRQKLDPVIDWIADPNAAGIKDKILKTMRSDMSKRMVEAAEASGNPEWAAVMRRFHDKLSTIDNMKEMLGKTSRVRERRIESVIANLFGKNKRWQRKFVQEFNNTFGGNTMSRAKAAQMAAKFGEEGKPGWLPVWGTGAGGATATNIAMTVPRALAMPLTAGLVSPKLAANYTLPMLKALEKNLKAAGVALSPRAASVMDKMQGPVSDAQRARLASILATELEAISPETGTPWRAKDAAEADTTNANQRRAGR